MDNGALERYYRTMQNVVLRDELGNPSIFVRHPQQKSSDFFASLPEHVHPAFIVNDAEDPAVLIGKYDGSTLRRGGTLYSLPYAAPETPGDGGMSPDEYLIRGRQFPGASGLTVADWGLLTLMAQRYYADGKGDPAHGNHNGQAWGYPGWSSKANYAPGAVVASHGWLYKCLKAHTSSDSLPPPNAVEYWEPVEKVGGVPIDTGKNFQRGLTLTGSGPLDWYFLNNISFEADMNGNVANFIYGVRLYDLELQVIATGTEIHNDAADPDAVISAAPGREGGHWKAIRPHPGDPGYTLVEPGTPGTIRLVRAPDGGLRYVAREVKHADYSPERFFVSFHNISVDEATIPVVPSILYELGLLPVPESHIKGGRGWFELYEPVDGRADRPHAAYFVGGAWIAGDDMNYYRFPRLSVFRWREGHYSYCTVLRPRARETVTA